MTVEGKMSDFDLVYAGAYMKRTNHTLAEYSDYSLFYDRVYGSGAYWTGNNGNPIMPQEFVIGGGNFEKWSQELRLRTPSSYFIRGTVGGFIQRQLHNIVQQYTMPGYGYTHVTSDPGVPGNPNGFSDYYSLPNLPNTIWLTDEQRVDRDKAIFAQFDWDITSTSDAHGRCASVLVRQLAGSGSSVTPAISRAIPARRRASGRRALPIPRTRPART